MGEKQATQWERLATTRWGSYLTQIERQHIVHAAQLARPPAQALEIGCGGGRWSQLLADRGWQMICTDVDRNALSACTQRIPTAKCILVKPDDSKLPWESATIRLLVCVEVDPVVNSNWFLDEAFRVLEPGGYMVAVAWNTYSLRAMYRRLKASLRGEQEIYYQTPYLAFRKKLIQRGFVMCREEGYCWGPFGRESNSPLIPAVVELEEWLGLRKLPTLSPWIIFIARKK